MVSHNQSNTNRLSHLKTHRSSRKIFAIPGASHSRVPNISFGFFVDLIWENPKSMSRQFPLVSSNTSVIHLPALHPCVWEKIPLLLRFHPSDIFVLFVLWLSEIYWFHANCRYWQKTGQIDRRGLNPSRAARHILRNLQGNYEDKRCRNQKSFSWRNR